MEDIHIEDSAIRSLARETMDLPSLIFQTGYLTFLKRVQLPDGNVGYFLRIPNKEVREALSEYLLKGCFNVDVPQQDLFTAWNIRRVLEGGEVEPPFQVCCPPVWRGSITGNTREDAKG